MSEDGRKYDGKNGSGTTMKGYQTGEVSYLSPLYRARGKYDNAKPESEIGIGVSCFLRFLPWETMLMLPLSKLQ